ncbi:TetR/AcrR family transcriptional regulator [Ruegeria atlantica]|uniref:TetR/AcrR family transcriptional regulator n=1 Tax=Ruegeria atlantica TaxID=81569 RepID=UPI00147FB251|nr:TetR/AcrR family transcriptional regulator [Ruegeria atlantica]
MALSTRDKLARTAAKLFQERGFHGVGLNEILNASGLPKGSLYHHFPNGKSDLALESAALAHHEMMKVIDEAFESANSYKSGATTLLYKLAKLFEVLGKQTGCPISEILFGGPEQEIFRKRSAEYFDAWVFLIAAHAQRLGETPESAKVQAEKLFITLQGGWTLARAKKNGDVIRNLAILIFDE